MLQDYKNCKPNFIKCNFKNSNLKLKVLIVFILLIGINKLMNLNFLALLFKNIMDI